MMCCFSVPWVSSFDAHFYYDFITHPFVPLNLLCLVFGFLYDVFFYLIPSLLHALLSFLHFSPSLVKYV